MSRYLATTAKDFGELIRGFRKERGWTQARLAERAGLLPKTVSAIETGNGQVLLANVMRCLAALDLDLSLDSRSRPERPPADETAGSPSPTRQARKSSRSSPADRTTPATRALEEKW